MPSKGADIHVAKVTCQGIRRRRTDRMNSPFISSTLSDLDVVSRLKISSRQQPTGSSITQTFVLGSSSRTLAPTSLHRRHNPISHDMCVYMGNTSEKHKYFQLHALSSCRNASRWFSTIGTRSFRRPVCPHQPWEIRTMPCTQFGS